MTADDPPADPSDTDGGSLFDRDTTIQQVSADTWSAMVSSAWNIGDVPNGGYSLSLVLRAMAAVGGHPDPLSVTCHFLRPVIGDAPATVTTDVVRSGRTISTVSGRLVQDGKERLVVMAALGDLAPDDPVVAQGSDPLAAPAPGWADLAPPDLPPPEHCVVRTGEAQGVTLALRSARRDADPPRSGRALSRRRRRGEWLDPLRR